MTTAPSPTARTVLFGLDGATYGLLDPLMAQGLMPNLAALIERGARAILRSTAHPLTPPAWTTLMTGRSPGVHGVFDFIAVDQEGENPSYALATSADVRSETIWSIASRHGKRVTTLNFPMMFPPPEVNGFVIPGYVPWSYIGRAVRPRDLLRRLKDEGKFSARELSTDWAHERKAIQGLAEDQLEEWVRFHIVRERRWFDILMFLMRNEPCELTAVLLDGVDRIQHLCYHLIDPATADTFDTQVARRVRELCLQYFRDVDSYLGEIVEVAGEDSHIVIASDHGFTRAGDKVFYTNTWLEQNGFLRWKNDVPVDKVGRLALDENTESGTLFDWSATNVFAFSSSSNGLYIRKANGSGGPGVTEDAYPAFRQSLIERLLAVKDPETGQPVVRNVMTADQAFPGPCAERGPDLTLELTDYSFQSVLRADAPLKPRPTPYGTHHPDGVFITAGPGVRAGATIDRMAICDVAATVLYSLGLPVPEDLEGVVPLSAYEAGYLEDRPVRFEEATDAGRLAAASTEQLPPEAEAQIRERLKALGYI